MNNSSKKSSTFKLLFLLGMLLGKELNKNEIVEEFNNSDIQFNKVSINKYISILKSSGINILTRKENNENYYKIPQKELEINLNKEELLIISQVKRLLIAQKDYKNIRRFMRILYKYSKFIKNQEVVDDLMNFGYYSTLNWHVVLKLEELAKTKDIVTIEYILPSGDTKDITLHLDCLKIGNLSNKLYIHGILENGFEFSHLPLDKIYRVKKVEQKCVPFNFRTPLLKYIISKEVFDKNKMGEQEKILKEDESYITLETPITDTFSILQKLFSYCPDLYYVSDENIKNALKEKLEILKASYD